MKNNHGFTLVELLAVIVILLALSLAAGWGITSVLNDRKSKECIEQQELAIGAAKIYFSQKNVTLVTISTLKSEKYFANNKKLDHLKDTDTISLNADKTNYTYKGTTCP